MESKIKQNVMRRVRTIHAVRPFTSGTVVGLAVLLISVYEIGRLVFVAQVFRNMPAVEDVPALLSFFMSAFINTDAAVQVLTVLMLFALAYIAKDVARAISSPRTAQ